MTHLNIYIIFYFVTVPSSMVQPNDSSASIPIDKPEDTPATDRIQDIQNPLTESKQYINTNYT